MEPFHFDLESEWGYLNYRFSGSFIFDKGYNPLMVDEVIDGHMYVTDEEGNCHSFDSETAQGLLYGVPEHGWIKFRNHLLYMPATFPDRKWKYGYEPHRDSAQDLTYEDIRRLATPVNSMDRRAFLSGTGIYSRAIASKGGVVYCHDASVGVIIDGIIQVKSHYDFMLYELEGMEVVVNDNL